MVLIYSTNFMQDHHFMKNFPPVIRIVNSCIMVLGVLFFASCGKDKKETKVEKDSLALTYTVRTQWAHDPEAFTQGLVIHNGKLFESTGQNGASWIGIVDINTGKADKKVELDKAYFGEGITILNNKVYQLTYKNKLGFVYDLRTFKRIGEFEFTSAEGWGLTHDGKNLIMSDGTENLTYLDTVTLQAVKTLKVTDESGAVKKLNELEYIEGFIYSNIWETNRIVKIDPATGKVVGRLDLSQLARDAQMRSPRVDVLNGIAYHPTTKLMLVTGKYWPMIYVLQVK
jgi:glutaminyl-peptide cyclotransferase